METLNLAVGDVALPGYAVVGDYACFIFYLIIIPTHKPNIVT